MNNEAKETVLRYATAEKPWMKHYTKASADAALPACTMYEQVKVNCEKYGRMEQKALHYYGTDILYREMFGLIDRYAASFHALGVKKGDFVTMIVPPLPESVCAVYALNKLGAVSNLVDPRTNRSTTHDFIRRAKSRVVFTIEMCAGQVTDAMEELGLDYVIGLDPGRSLPGVKRFFFRLKSEKYTVPYDGKKILTTDAFLALGEGKPSPTVAYEPDMPAIVTRTGGTTGIPKGVLLSNDNLNTVAANFFVTIPVTMPNQSFLNFIPIAASYGIAVATHMAMTMGMKDILIPRFEADKFDQIVMQFRPRHIIGVPMLYEKLIDSPLLAKKDLSFINTMAAGGDSANDSLEDKLDRFRLSHGIEHPVAQGYGMSEVASACAFGFRGVHKKGSSGIPCYFNTIAAFEPDTDRELPIGQVGEICITGRSVMLGYLGDPEETANVLRRHSDGQTWVHSGDLGYIDEDGYLFIVGRIKRIIIRCDGHKVFPLQIERIVMKHPSVANCSVIAVRDRSSEQGVLPLVCVEPIRGTPDTEKLRKDLLALCANELGEIRDRPAGILFVDSIPLTGLSKNDYKTLETQYREYDYTK